ncbi:Hypothetical Protein FCC1311_056922 [Hondaea fermentalgiana]|uniref:Uncharacterized protein n=1 Tax=Hondaea fermentalgiana TaxID=2315210 RepID=A0A2R5GME2_9STRA|nr:Hypothetical Protein FCC1311_056922 [Hondaea fermentalgiana]|eukprot:GBG29471.1 Hypothetical Protein FCC1311_056922 [Hondaea fermentalgiana]
MPQETSEAAMVTEAAPPPPVAEGKKEVEEEALASSAAREEKSEATLDEEKTEMMSAGEARRQKWAFRKQSPGTVEAREWFVVANEAGSHELVQAVENGYVAHTILADTDVGLVVTNDTCNVEQ